MAVLPVDAIVAFAARKAHRPRLADATVVRSVAADRSCRRVDDGDGGRHGEHRLYGVAALGEWPCRRARPRKMGRGDGRAGEVGRFHPGPA